MRTCSSADCIKRLRCPTVCGWLNKCPNCSSQTPPRDQECIISELACPTVGCTGSRVAVRLQAQPSLTPSSIRPGAPEAAQPGQVLPPTHRQPTGASAHCIAWLSAKQRHQSIPLMMKGEKCYVRNHSANSELKCCSWISNITKPATDYKYKAEH